MTEIVMNQDLEKLIDDKVNYRTAILNQRMNNLEEELISLRRRLNEVVKYGKSKG